MKGEAPDGGGLPVLSSRQRALSVETDSLVKRGLDLLAATGVGPPATARTELATARHFWNLGDRLLSGPNAWDAQAGRFLDLAERPLSDPADWVMFARHCRDGYRHTLRA